MLLSYWKGKPNTTSNQEQLKRVTALQEEALKELRRPVQPLQRDAAPGGAARAGPAAGAAVGTGRPTAAEVPAACRDVYTRAHALLGRAACLVFDTETGGFVNPSVIDLDPC